MDQEYFEEILEWYIENEEQTRFDLYGGYPSQYTCYKDRVFVATVDHDGGPQLDEYDIVKIKHRLDVKIKHFLKSQEINNLPPFLDLRNHENFDYQEDFGIEKCLADCIVEIFITEKE